MRSNKEKLEGGYTEYNFKSTIHIKNAAELNYKKNLH